MVIVFYALLWPTTDMETDFIEDTSLLLMPGFGNKSPEPGAKNPIYCLSGSNKFLAKIGMSIWYSLILSGVKHATNLASSFGISIDLGGSNLTSFLYLSGTLHSYSRGMRASFLTANFCLVETPTYDGGKNNLP